MNSYAPQIATLERAARKIKTNIDSLEQGLQYHVDALERDRFAIVQLGEEEASIRSAVETLKLMDKAGMTMKSPAPGVIK
jgi:prefoldin subunit 5